MRLFLALIFFLLLLNLGQAQTTSERLDSFMIAAFNANEFNGVVLVARNDSLILSKGYGWRDVENKIPHDTNSIFQIGSLTKTFTATAVLFLQEQGKLNIDDNLDKYFPSYKYANKIRIKNLLSHTSGIFNYTTDKIYDPEKSFSQENFWEIINDKPLILQPDSRYEYSNSNYFLLGLLIEKITGKSYEQAIREIIFERAGMNHSGFDFARLKNWNKCIGYDVDKNGKHVRSIIADSSGTFSAGSMYTTVGDLYRWYKALLSNAIIDKNTFTQAVTAYKGPYGYGWQVDSAYGHLQWRHDGGVMGFSASFRSLPDENACIIILRNETLYPSVVNVGFLCILYDIPNYYIPRLAIPANSTELQEYVGTYKLDGPQNYEIILSARNGLLHSVATGGIEDDFYKMKKDFYFLKSYDCHFVFMRNQRGEVIGLEGHLGKLVFNYKKIK